MRGLGSKLLWGANEFGGVGGVGERWVWGPGCCGGEMGLESQWDGERALGSQQVGGRGLCPGAPGKRSPPEESSFWLPLYGSMCCRLVAQPRCMAAPVTSGFLLLQVSAGWGRGRGQGWRWG